MAAEKSLGVELKNTTSGYVIGGLTSIGEFGPESEEIDVTALDSTGGYREFIGSLKDAGEVPVTGFVKDNAQMITLLALAEAQTVVDWQLTFTSGASWDFTAFLKSFKEGESTIDGARTFTGALRISGAPTFEDNISA